MHHGNTPDGKWTYADTQEELLQLVNIFGGFHDACIKEMKYLSGSYVASNLSMNPIDDIRQVRIVFQRQWENPSCIEVIFEGVQQLNLVPGRDGYSSDIFQAYLMARDGFVYFCDYTDEIDRLVKNAYFCTWIKALSLRWRIADEYLGNELIYNNTK
ncbi:MAG: hypothetical protein A2Y16_04425 [Tenericutes bacterium GWF2_57_13]|nr:MAG: hypothetical protein A2Y16_04425 [Tenericutes bacterium GWF2_57_13]